MLARFSFSFCLTMVVMGILAPICFAQQNVDSRVRRLENEIQTLSRAVFRGENPSAQMQAAMSGNNAQQQSAIANMSVRLSQLEAQIRTLTGQIEQQGHTIRQLEAKLQQSQMVQQQVAPQAQFQNQAPQAQQPYAQQQYIAPPQQKPAQYPNNGTKTMSVEGNNGYMANTLGTVSTNSDGSANMAVNTQNPTYVYDSAFSMLQKGDYDAAEGALKVFLQKYPEHPLTANAQYWLGETYYVRNNFQESAKVFAGGYQKFPQSPKAPDNLLKLALSLSNLGQNEEACITLSQLKTQFPKAPGSLLRKADEERTRLSCQ